jgi:hypothetical protein
MQIPTGSGYFPERLRESMAAPRAVRSNRTDAADLPFEDNSYDEVISFLERARRRIRWEPMYSDGSTDFFR